MCTFYRIIVQVRCNCYFLHSHHSQRIRMNLNGYIQWFRFKQDKDWVDGLEQKQNVFKVIKKLFNFWSVALNGRIGCLFWFVRPRTGFVSSVLKGWTSSSMKGSGIIIENKYLFNPGLLDCIPDGPCAIFLKNSLSFLTNLLFLCFFLFFLPFLRFIFLLFSLFPL